MPEATSMQDFARYARRARLPAHGQTHLNFLKEHIMPEPISNEALYQILGSASAPQVVDVRRAAAYEASTRVLPAAMRGAPEEIATWSARLSRARPVVAYCVHGHEVSQDAARALQGMGFHAQHLEGGIEQWIAAGRPTIARRGEFNVPGTSRWITRERPKIDRLACPWLVRRFIDPQAQFFYVPAAQVRAQAITLQAQPYDIADTTFSHVGAQCSFDAFLAQFDLRDPALDKLAGIVRAADTDTLEQAPQAAGLLAISIGLCTNIADDHALLESAMPIYDALYTWCKSAHTEKHNWPYPINPPSPQKLAA
jgi:rhodanese-related sulfurtransferase